MALTPKASKLGENGEQFVADYLTKIGYQIMSRNWRVREGELDIVARDQNGLIIFVEVKTRTSIAFGDPLESIDRKKLFRIQKLALAWLATNLRLGNPYRIDSAGVIISRSGEITLDYRKGIS
ncbi:MAG: YraN family protein [Actinomycetales bacterium]|nr:YraN family protein [Actinomycetales bacterium]